MRNLCASPYDAMWDGPTPRAWFWHHRPTIRIRMPAGIGELREVEREVAHKSNPRRPTLAWIRCERVRETHRITPVRASAGLEGHSESRPRLVRRRQAKREIANTTAIRLGKLRITLPRTPPARTTRASGRGAACLAPGQLLAATGKRKRPVQSIPESRCGAPQRQGLASGTVWLARKGYRAPTVSTRGGLLELGG